MVVTEIKLKDIEIHELALSTPKMTDEQFEALKTDIAENGQLEPIKLYRAKVVDGRHRVLAMRELQSVSIKAIHLNPSTPIEEVRQLVASHETRRHQTPTQKAIYALHEYDRLRASGAKESQEVVCARYGTNKLMLSRAKKLDAIVSKAIMDHMFNGGKVNIGTTSKPLLSDSLLSVYNHFKSREADILSESQCVATNLFSDDELNTLKTKVQELQSEFGLAMLEKLSSMLYGAIKTATPQ